VTRFFTNRVHMKEIGPIAVEYMQRRPGLAAAIPANLPVKAKRKPPKRKAPKVEGAREATAEEIPLVLRDPPWRRPRRPIARRVVKVAPTEWEEHVVFADDEDRNEASEHDDPAVRALATRGARGIEALEARMRETPGGVLPFAARCVDSPRIAVAVALAAGIPKLVEHVELWVSRFPRAAALGALPAALGAPSREQAAAAKLVDMLSGAGMGDVIREAARAYGAEAKAAVDELLDVVPLQACPNEPPSLPRFVSPSALPAVAVPGGALLPASAMLHFLEMLVFSDPDEPYAGIARVARACEPRSLDAFLAALVQAWVKHRSPASGEWVLDAVAQMGRTDAVREVVRAIRAWVRGRATRQRAIAGLEALARGGDAALTALADLAQKGNSRTIVEHATELMGSVAQERGMNEDDLADRLVPTLDLEADGSAVLDYGTRSFKVTLDEHLAPRIVGADGAVVASAPKAKKTDDPAKARAAIARMKSLKAGLAGLARTLVFRWELAMIDGRKWRELRPILEHPIQGRLARTLVWGAYSAGRLVHTFRVAEDGTFAGEDDERFELAPGTGVGIPHPFELGAPLCARWAGVLADYELIAPFPQVSRPIATATDDEKQTRTVQRFEDVEVPYMALMGRIEARGWKRSESEGGIASGHHRRIRGVEAWFAFTVDWNEVLPETIAIGRVGFARFDPVVFSEIAYDLSVFGQRA
jgi:hypothetical protein